jgi:glutathione S-transferase
MASLYHHPLDPHSRFVRLALAESGVAVELIEERPWERSEELLTLNPACSVPVMVDDDDLVIPGAYAIAEYLDETFGGGQSEHRLLPRTIEARVEVRRLLDWFLGKFHSEVAEYLVTEKVFKRFMPSAFGGGSPDTGAIRAAKTNVRYHLRYVGYLVRCRNWLAGERLTFADLAAAAQLSVVDYLGDVPWDEDPAAKDWYARVKSRPSFRPLLSETVRGAAPPSPTYADLDF